MDCETSQRKCIMASHFSDGGLVLILAYFYHSENSFAPRKSQRAPEDAIRGAWGAVGIGGFLPVCFIGKFFARGQ